MWIRLFILIFGSIVLLSCEINKPQPYQPIDPADCSSSSDSEIRVTLNTPQEIDSDNASNYTLSGSCRGNNEVVVIMHGHPLSDRPICNREKWETSIDVTRIVNQRNHVQVAVSQAGSSGVLCKNVKNYFRCPSGYIGVPQLEDFTYSDFCVMKYEAKVGSGTDIGTLYNPKIVKAEARANGDLIRKRNKKDAIQYCEENGPGYRLINNKEWQTIARHIETVVVNWSDNSIDVKNGNYLNIGSVSYVQSTSDKEDEDINDRWDKNNRWHKLTNGEYIWDFSGNLAEIVNHTINSLPATHKGYIYNLPEELRALFGPDRDYSILDDKERLRGFGGLGYMEGVRFEGSIVRGGYNRITAGIFSVDTSIDEDRINTRNNIGFRCVYHP